MILGKKHYLKILLLIIGLIIISICSLVFFPTKLNFLLSSKKLFQIIYKIRLPEIFIAISTGACLGLSGALMQIVLGNSLASPFTLGVSSAAAFGAAFSIIVGTNYGLTWLYPGVSAFIFSLFSLFLLIMMSSTAGVSKKNIILIGMAVNFFFSSANTLLQYYASPDSVYQISFWTKGSLTIASIKDSVILFILLFISLSIFILFSKDLSLIQEGERNAIMHGVNVTFERVLFLIICSLLASFSISIVGIIGFIGLVSPHIARLLGLSKPNLLIISSTITGSIFLTFADIISKSLLYPTILPVSSVTSFLGIPILLFLLFASRRFKR